MNDWKDALSALMNSGDIPEGKPESDGSGAPGEKTPEKTADRKKRPQTEALNVVFERKGRGGKSATIIEGFMLPDEDVEEIASRLRKKLGTGGSSRGGEILLQGECREKAAQVLRELGFSVKGVK